MMIDFGSWPSFIPPELLPSEVMDLTEQITQGRTREPDECFSSERAELFKMTIQAKALVESEHVMGV